MHCHRFQNYNLVLLKLFESEIFEVLMKYKQKTKSYKKWNAAVSSAWKGIFSSAMITKLCGGNFFQTVFWNWVFFEFSTSNLYASCNNFKDFKKVWVHPFLSILFLNFQHFEDPNFSFSWNCLNFLQKMEKIS